MAEDPLERLTTEARNPAGRDLDLLSTREFVAKMADEDRVAVEAVRAELDAVAVAIDAIVARLARGGRLVYAGAGTSGRLGVLDAAECPPTFNVPSGLVVGLIAGGEGALLRAVEGAEDDPDAGVAELDRLALAPDDVVVGIAASGRTPYVLGAIGHARRRGALTIGLSCNRGSELERAAELSITPVVGPELISGSTRLKAGTATKLVLNMLSTAAMVRLGKTYGDLMVDLQATNQKLAARSRRIVAEAASITPDAAAVLLARCGGEVKTAIVVARSGLSPARARDRLQAQGGRVRAALDEDVRR